MKITITSDAHQWIVNEVTMAGEKSRTPGAEVVKPVSYHPSIEHAVRSACDRALRRRWPPGGAELAAVAHLVLDSMRDVREAITRSAEFECLEDEA